LLSLSSQEIPWVLVLANMGASELRKDERPTAQTSLSKGNHHRQVSINNHAHRARVNCKRHARSYIRSQQKRAQTPATQEFQVLGRTNDSHVPVMHKFDEHRRAVLAGTKPKVKGEKFVATFSKKPVLTLYGGSND
jgi:hypothetical protein